jgi:hypothetical protein
MRKTMLAAAAILTISSAAFAQSTVIVTDPAPTGSVVLPGEVRTYVMEQNTPSVVYDGDIVVGTTLPDTAKCTPCLTWTATPIPLSMSGA